MAVGSFSAGLSGLNANSVYLSVIGNNLSNINTIGFKASSRDVHGPGQPERLAVPASTRCRSAWAWSPDRCRRCSTRARSSTTGEPTNAAIQGNGFFVVRGPDAGIFYTRAGNFSLNNEGALITPDGYRVQGFTQTDPLTGDIITTGQPERHHRARRRAARSGGDVADPDHDQPRRRCRSPAARSTRPVQIFDSLGASHVLTVTYTQHGDRLGLRHDRAGRRGDAGEPPARVRGRGFGDLRWRRTGEQRHRGGPRHRRRRGPGRDRRRRSRPRPGPTAPPRRPITWDLVDANVVVSLTGFAVALGHGLQEPERRGGRQDRQHQHQRGRRHRRHLRRRPDRRGRQDRAGQLQQPEGAREDGLEPLRRKPGVGHSERRQPPAPAAAAR